MWNLEGIKINAIHICMTHTHTHIYFRTSKTRQTFAMCWNCKKKPNWIFLYKWLSACACVRVCVCIRTGCSMKIHQLIEHQHLGRLHINRIIYRRSSWHMYDMRYQSIFFLFKYSVLICVYLSRHSFWIFYKTDTSLCIYK